MTEFVVDMSNLKLLVDVYYKITAELSVVLSGSGKGTHSEKSVNGAIGWAQDDVRVSDMDCRHPGSAVVRAAGYMWLAVGKRGCAQTTCSQEAHSLKTFAAIGGIFTFLFFSNLDRSHSKFM